MIGIKESMNIMIKRNPIENSNIIVWPSIYFGGFF